MRKLGFQVLQASKPAENIKTLITNLGQPRGKNVCFLPKKHKNLSCAQHNRFLGFSDGENLKTTKIIFSVNYRFLCFYCEEKPKNLKTYSDGQI